MKLIRKFLSFLPTLLTALVLAIIVWVSSVTASDPNQVITYETPIQLEILGQNPDLVITHQEVEGVTVTLKAPRSVHAKLANDPSLISANINLSGLEAGDHALTPEVIVDLRPVQVVEISPASVDLTLEKVASKTMPISLIQTGSLPVGYQTRNARLSEDEAKLVGPEPLVKTVVEVAAFIDVSELTTSINRTLDLKPLNEAGVAVEGVVLSPNRVDVSIDVEQLVGYRKCLCQDRYQRLRGAGLPPDQHRGEPAYPDCLRRKPRPYPRDAGFYRDRTGQLERRAAEF